MTIGGDRSTRVGRVTRPASVEKLVAQSMLMRRVDAPGSGHIAAAIRVRDSNGRLSTIFETWKPTGWFGLVAEQQFRLRTGEAVEQLAENVFIVLTTGETLVRVTEPASHAECSSEERARAA